MFSVPVRSCGIVDGNSAVSRCCATAQESSKLTAMGMGIVVGVRDGRTLLLAGGRELRLAAIEVTDKTAARRNHLSMDATCD